MSNNMVIASSSATYTFTDNPTTYRDEEVSFEDNQRNANAGLVNYNKGVYHVFTLTFDNIGTAQYANFGTFFRAKQNITFYPYDEVKGTSTSYVVRIVGNFNFRNTDYFWNSGFRGELVFEQV